MGPKIANEAEFKKEIKSLISQDRNVDYFTSLLKAFDHYTNTFEGVFNDRAQTAKNNDKIYRFLVEYKGLGGGGKKTLARRVFEIPGSCVFEDLAEYIILSMGWVNDHMHEFKLVGKKAFDSAAPVGSSLVLFADDWEDDPHPTYKTSQIHIADIDYKMQPKFEFMFDYGDGHTFVVTEKGSRKPEEYDDPTQPVRLIESSGVAPEQYPPY